MQAFEQRAGVRVTLAETAARARDLIQNLEINKLERAVRAAREVAVIAYDRGKIAVFPRGAQLHIPTGAGAGQDSCRRVLANHFGQAYGRLRYLGMSRGTDSTPAIEVWLAEDVTARDGAFIWTRLEDLLFLLTSEKHVRAMLAAGRKGPLGHLIGPDPDGAPPGGGPERRARDAAPAARGSGGAVRGHARAYRRANGPRAAGAVARRARSAGALRLAG